MIGAIILLAIAQPLGQHAPPPPSTDQATVPAAPDHPTGTTPTEPVAVQDAKTLPDAPAPSPGGRLKIGGALRGRYDLRFNDADRAGARRTSSHLSFDTAILTADYDSPVVYGAAQYRFYGGSFLYGRRSGYDGYPGEISFPVYAYVGAKLGGGTKVAVGVQPVPFDDRFWGSAFLNSLGFVYGMEEVYNAGVTVSHSGGRYTVEGGFFPTTAPNAFGISDDSARYSVNIVKGDASVPSASRNAERAMAIGRIQYRLVPGEKTSLVLSGSAWFSTVHNFTTGRDGSRRAFALSLRGQDGPWRGKLLAARQNMDLRNAGSDDLVTVGNYDAPFNIATRGTLLFGEVGRAVDTGALPFKLDLYANYARFLKDGTVPAPDTQRLNVGAFWTDKATGRIRIWSEMLVGRNDPFVGAGQYSLGAATGGDDRYKLSALVIFGYYF